MREVTYEIERHIAVIAEHTTGWNKELNMVSWNGNKAKYDIRDWSANHTMMGRDSTFTEEEMKAVFEALKGEWK